MQGRLVEYVTVRRHRTLNDRLAQPPHGFDDDLRRIARCGIRREHDPGLLGVHHPLDDHGHGHLGRHAALDSIEEHARAERRRPAGFDVLNQDVDAADVEKTLEHAGERELGRILGGGRRAHRDARRSLEPFRQRGVRGADRLTKRVGKVAVHDHLLQRTGGARERGWIAGIKTGQLDGNARRQVVRLVESTVGFDGQNKTGRHRQTDRGHLTEVGALATNGRDIRSPNVGERTDQRLLRLRRFRVRLLDDALTSPRSDLRSSRAAVACV